MKNVLVSVFVCASVFAHTIINAQENTIITAAQFNTKLGDGALASIVNGQANTALGAFSLNHNDGSFNTGTGAYSLFKSTIGNGNTAMGYEALFENTSGDNNTAVGMWSLLNNKTGYNNSAFGRETLFLNKSGTSNCAFGFASMYSNTTGFGNTAFGYKTLQTNTTGSNNTAIGLGADISVNNLTNATALGYSTKATASNQVRIGNSAVTSIGGFVDWTDLPSDGRFKQNVKENIPGLQFIKLLRPVTYTVDVAAVNKRLGIQADNNESLAAKANEIHSGFVAQEVETAAKRLNYNFNGVDAPKNADDMYGIRYSKFVVPLVKAVQELSDQNDEKDKLINELNNKINSIQEKLDLLLQQKNISSVTDRANANYNTATLGQNVPNPFNKNTIIKYKIPSSAKNAAINIYNTNGEIIKTINITAKGSGQISLNGAEFSAGTYYYTLILDGAKTGSNKMIVMK